MVCFCIHQVEYVVYGFKNPPDSEMEGLSLEMRSLLEVCKQTPQLFPTRPKSSVLIPSVYAMDTCGGVGMNACGFCLRCL